MCTFIIYIILPVYVNPYKTMLEAVGKKISLNPQPAVKKSLAEAITFGTVKKSCVAYYAPYLGACPHKGMPN